MNKIMLNMCFAVVVSMHGSVTSASIETVEAQQITQMHCGKVGVIAQWVKDSLLQQKFEHITEEISDHSIKVTGEIKKDIFWPNTIADKKTTESMQVVVTIDSELVMVIATYMKKIFKKTIKELEKPEYNYGWVGSRTTMQGKKEEVCHQKATSEVEKQDIQCFLGGLKEINTFANGTHMRQNRSESYKKLEYKPTAEEVAQFYHQ